MLWHSFPLTSAAAHDGRMPLPNRVDPFGALHAVPERGRFTGNRGCLVDDAGRFVRHHRGTLWIICRTAFRGRRVGLTRPRRWTPIFFLDDAVALAAGHRPCGECRHAEYLAYREAVEAAVGSPLRAGDLNRRLAARTAGRTRAPAPTSPTARSCSPTDRASSSATGCTRSPSRAGTTPSRARPAR